MGLETGRNRLKLVLALFYGLAGVLHIAIPAPFLTITPAWVPYAPQVIWLTGLCEIAGATGLLVPSLRRYAAAGLALYAVCVFPANIKHAIDSLSQPSPSVLQWTYHTLRMPLQPLIIWSSLFAGGLINWPWRNGQ